MSMNSRTPGWSAADGLMRPASFSGSAGPNGWPLCCTGKICRTLPILLGRGSSAPRPDAKSTWPRAVLAAMMEHVKVEEINIGPSDAIVPVDSVTALARKGLRGDRHFFADGAAAGEALTLIEAEVLEDVDLTGAQSRRRVVVRGVRLADLIGERLQGGGGG